MEPDDAARAAATRVGLYAVKTRWRAHSVDNHGEFQLLDKGRNTVVAGDKFDLTADQVIEFCRHYDRHPERRGLS